MRKNNHLPIASTSKTDIPLAVIISRKIVPLANKLFKTHPTQVKGKKPKFAKMLMNWISGD